MGSLIILSGPVGAGKTTVARYLVAAAPAPLAYVEGDTFWSFIAKPALAQSSQKSFTMIMRAMLAAARHYARDDYDVIVDFSIPPWYLEGVRALLAGKPFDYVVLRPSESVCAERAAARTAGSIADYAPYRNLYASFDGLEQWTIADDAGAPQLLAERIRAGLLAGTFRMT